MLPVGPAGPCRRRTLRLPRRRFLPARPPPARGARGSAGVRSPHTGRSALTVTEGASRPSRPRTLCALGPSLSCPVIPGGPRQREAQGGGWRSRPGSQHLPPLSLRSHPRLKHRARSREPQATLPPGAPQLDQSSWDPDGAQCPSVPSPACLPATANRDSTVALAG